MGGSVINSFFELCEGHQKWLDLGLLQEGSFEETTAQRNNYFDRLLGRLEECQTRPTTLNTQYGVGQKYYPMRFDEVYRESEEPAFLNFLNIK